MRRASSRLGIQASEGAPARGISQQLQRTRMVAPASREAFWRRLSDRIRVFFR
jgi:hypothetical protein